MDINDLRSISTVLAFVAFVSFVGWAWSAKRKPAFDEAARLPLEEDDLVSDGGTADQHH